MATTMTKKVADTFNRFTESKADWSIERKGNRTWLHTPQGRFEVPSNFFSGTSSTESATTVLFKGFLSGLAGTAATTLAMQAMSSLLGPAEAERQGQEFGPPRQDTRRQEPTETFVERAAATVAQQPITEEQKQTLGQVTHWLYGGFWGAVYAVTQSALRVPEPVGGTLLGAAVWGIGPLSLFPRMGLSRPTTEQDSRTLATNGALHTVYGWATAYTFKLLSRGQ